MPQCENCGGIYTSRYILHLHQLRECPVGSLKAKRRLERMRPKVEQFT